MERCGHCAGLPCPLAKRKRHCLRARRRRIGFDRLRKRESFGDRRAALNIRQCRGKLRKAVFAKPGSRRIRALRAPVGMLNTTRAATSSTAMSIGGIQTADSKKEAA